MKKLFLAVSVASLTVAVAPAAADPGGVVRRSSDGWLCKFAVGMANSYMLLPCDAFEGAPGLEMLAEDPHGDLIHGRDRPEFQTNGNSGVNNASGRSVQK